jgi:hypothetical protein
MRVKPLQSPLKQSDVGVGVGVGVGDGDEHALQLIEKK